jgi:hypothetical protein
MDFSYAELGARVKALFVLANGLIVTIPGLSVSSTAFFGTRIDNPTVSIFELLLEVTGLELMTTSVD